MARAYVKRYADTDAGYILATAPSGRWSRRCAHRHDSGVSCRLARAICREGTEGPLSFFSNARLKEKLGTGRDILPQKSRVGANPSCTEILLLRRWLSRVFDPALGSGAASPAGPR
jgi:hypothetical protein